MSRGTNEEKLISPASRFLDWKSGSFSWYNKETKEKIAIPLPVKFLVLDTLSTVKGWSDQHQSGIWSNEVRDVKKDVMTVYCKTGMLSKGLYESVKADPKCTGAKYSQSVYIALMEEGKLELCNIQMTGAALSSWIEFVKENNIYKGAVEVLSSIQGKKGATVYQIPVFTKSDVPEEINEQAKELDVTLQEYLVKYFERNKEKELNN